MFDMQGLFQDFARGGGGGSNVKYQLKIKGGSGASTQLCNKS